MRYSLILGMKKRSFCKIYSYKQATTHGKERNLSKRCQGSCSFAHESGYEWRWVDTCCIDKTSSAELSEAINSMFRWYVQSHVCFAYLSDVQVDHSEPAKLDGFETSRWHKRGWTLQELLAPERVEFYDLNWNQIGTRPSLRERISKITGIRAGVLIRKFDAEASQHKYCVAEKMSWAANRETTRVEDLAYCLLGIFNVNMPLLYGEGQRAFERLQFQILAETEDLTLFAWKSPREFAENLSLTISKFFKYGPLFARSPSDFQEFIVESPGKFTYQSLHAVSYERVWEELRMIGSNSIKIKSGIFVLEPPAKRLDTLALSIAIIPDSKTSSALAILCKFRRQKADASTREYLCLPVCLLEDPTLYARNGLPRRAELRLSSSNVRLQRISIRLQPEYVLGSDWEPVPEKATAVILSLQGPGSSPTQIFGNDYGFAPYTTVLLRHGLNEHLVLYGQYTTGRGASIQVIPWTIITNWEELPTFRGRVLTEADERNVGDFAQRGIGNGAHMHCTIKRRVRDWCLSHRSAMPESQFQALVSRSQDLFSLDVVVESCEGRLEWIEYLCSKEFDSIQLKNSIDESNPSPRDMLLAKPAIVDGI
jgi:hypothetical protein